MFVLAAIGVILFYFFSLIYPRSAIVLILMCLGIYVTEQPLTVFLAAPFFWFSYQLDSWSIEYMKKGVEDDYDPPLT